MKNRWHTQADANGNVTLYDAHDAKGRPGRIVEGWIDGASSPASSRPTTPTRGAARPPTTPCSTSP